MVDPWAGREPLCWDRSQAHAAQLLETAVLATISFHKSTLSTLFVNFILFFSVCGVLIKYCSFNFLTIGIDYKLVHTKLPFYSNSALSLLNFPAGLPRVCLLTHCNVWEAAATPFSMSSAQAGLPPDPSLFSAFLLQSLLLVSNPLFLHLSFIEFLLPQLF